MPAHPALYHYTTGHKLPGILAAGALRPSRVPPWAPWERPLLWLSSNDVYEPSARKPMLDPATGARVLDFELLRARVGIYRLVVDQPPASVVRWPRCGVNAGMRELHRVRLAGAGLAMGAQPSQWWACEHALPVAGLQLQWLDDSYRWQADTLAAGVARFGALGTAVASLSEHTGRVSA